ncbi:hypothetical protein BI040_gp28 [Escherichia phage vB_EcoS_NBD2]|uniref:Uncharacterized protein n=1 Tax=Escherichia phage vB_EcoS_NBD2 TaxID=1852563 RepID=A0A192YAR0_9CAUD|nr:hypothetical protein BI040_gp28 [Escherichia phage vB_EcoS_NBD2]ANM45926.1 hypothetical protein NBD2_84 [Escherichia phage vB_EcoS_NBD2]
MKHAGLIAALARAERLGLYVRREHRSNGMGAPITTVTIIHWTEEAYDILVERDYTSGNASAQADCINKTCNIIEQLTNKGLSS